MFVLYSIGSKGNLSPSLPLVLPPPDLSLKRSLGKAVRSYHAFQPQLDRRKTSNHGTKRAAVAAG